MAHNEPFGVDVQDTAKADGATGGLIGTYASQDENGSPADLKVWGCYVRQTWWFQYKTYFLDLSWMSTTSQLFGT